MAVQQRKTPAQVDVKAESKLDAQVGKTWGRDRGKQHRYFGIEPVLKILFCQVFDSDISTLCDAI